MKSLDGVNDRTFWYAFEFIKAVQNELTHFGIEATWTYIWETKSIRVKLWYSIHNEHRSIEVWLTEQDFKQGFARQKLMARIETMRHDVANQRYLHDKRQA